MAFSKLNRWNPLNIEGTDLNPNVNLMAKMVVCGLFLKGYFNKLSQHYLPIVPIFEYMGTGAQFELLLKVLMILSSLMIIFNVRVRLGCFILGMVFITVPLSSHVSYTNAKIFCGCILFLASLMKKGEESSLIRYQMVIMYFGAGLNKLFDPHWQSGQYFEHWMEFIVERSRYVHLSGLLPELWLSKFMCWLTIATEFSLAMMFSSRRYLRPAILFGIVFHLSALIGARFDFGIYTVAILAGYVALIPWPDASTIERTNAGLMNEGPRAQGLAAFGMSLIYKPLTYAIVVLLLCLPRNDYHWLIVRFAMGILALLLAGIVIHFIGKPNK